MTTTQNYFAIGALFGTGLTLLIQFLIPKFRKWQQARREEAEAKLIAEEERLLAIVQRKRLYAISFHNVTQKIFGDQALDKRNYYVDAQEEPYTTEVASNVQDAIVWLAEDLERIEEVQNSFVRPQGSDRTLKIVFHGTVDNRSLFLYEHRDHKEEQIILRVTEYSIQPKENQALTVDELVNRQTLN